MTSETMPTQVVGGPVRGLDDALARLTALLLAGLVTVGVAVAAKIKIHKIRYDLLGAENSSTDDQRKRD